MVETDSTSW